MLEKLEKVQQLYKELHILQKQIVALKSESTCDVVVGSSTEYPYISHRIKVEGQGVNTGKKMEILKNRYEQKAMEFKTAKEEVIADIEREVEDPEIREILVLRYIDGLSYSQIAIRLSYADRSGPRKKVVRYFDGSITRN